MRKNSDSHLPKKGLVRMNREIYQMEMLTKEDGVNKNISHSWKH